MNCKSQKSQGLSLNQSKEKILIIGVDSQIGVALSVSLSEAGFDVFGTTRKRERTSDTVFYLDLESPNNEVLKNGFSVVVFCAASTSVSACEKYPEKHKLINVTNTVKLIAMAVSLDIFVIYLSSNAVFDGKKKRYRYDEEPSPITKYGEFKREVESSIGDSATSKVAVLRLTKVITKNTPFIDRWKAEAAAGATMKVFSNVYLSPLPIYRVLDAVEILINKRRAGIFQLSGDFEISFAEYARLIFKDDEKALALLQPTLEGGEEHVRFNSLTSYLPS